MFYVIVRKLHLFGYFRYLQPPSEWISCALESRELLSLCLKKLKGLNRVKLVDAGFVWTEPHSKRIKVCCYTQYFKLVVSLLFYYQYLHERNPPELYKL